MTKHQHGNVFLYLLIGVALFAGLTLVLTRSQNSGDEGALSQAQIGINAQRLITYASQVATATLQMKDTGTDLDELDLVLPLDGTFETGPNIHKLFHPEGGGMTYNTMNEETFRAGSAEPVGWKFVKVNADWTAASDTDFIMTYIQLKAPICAEINLKLTGNATIPSATVNYADTFVDGTTPLAEANCAECKTHGSLCLENGGVYAFYNLIEAR